MGIDGNSFAYIYRLYYNQKYNAIIGVFLYMRIAVLVSGGVDSAVSLCLLKRAGYDVTAFYLKIWLEDELSFLNTCPWEEDLGYVRAVCKSAEVPLEVVSFQRAYWDTVVAYTIAEIRAGRTPNPDIMCNKHVKFGAFAAGYGAEFDKIATGHYAQVRQEGDYYHLYTAPDPVKDQTYFLSHLTHEQLVKALFPIGQYYKHEVRALAHEFDLANKDRKDSQGICFLGKLRFSDFVRHHVGTQVGDLIEIESGSIMGTHEGFWYYTIGQRQGIGLSGGPWYVVAKDAERNIVYISRSYYAEEKKRDTFVVSGINWLGAPATLPGEYALKLRHGPAYHQGHIEQLADDAYRVTLKERDQGIASGQYAVLYKDGRCLGGGKIVREE